MVNDRLWHQPNRNSSPVRPITKVHVLDVHEEQIIEQTDALKNTAMDQNGVAICHLDAIARLRALKPEIIHKLGQVLCNLSSRALINCRPLIIQLHAGKNAHWPGLLRYRCKVPHAVRMNMGILVEKKYKVTPLFQGML